MNHKFLSKFAAMLMCVIALGMASCGDDDEEKVNAPIVEVKEANIEGKELCVEANITAEGRTAAITIKINGTDGTEKAAKQVTDSKYIGKLNIPDFHVHVDIDNKGVEVGDILSITVADEKNNTVTSTKNITEEEDEDEEEEHDK